MVLRVALLAGMALVSPLSALTFEIDYGYDEGYFTANPGAKLALEKAAFDLGAAIRPSLAAVPTNVFTGMAGDPGDPSTVTFTWSLHFVNPSRAGVTEAVSAFSLGADVFRIYAGARLLENGELGVGGTVGLGPSLQTVSSADELVAAVSRAEAASNALMRRTGGPLMAEVTDSVTLDMTTANYTLQVGAIAGTIAFDLDADWHFDLNTMPGAEESDFYSVALHELIHAIGFGTSTTWNDLVIGNDWLGPKAGALAAGGVGLIDTGTGESAHILAGTISATISNAAEQEVVMDPDITSGTRKELTELDIAFLQDLGYDAVPEPRAVALLGLAAAWWLLGRRRN